MHAHIHTQIHTCSEILWCLVVAVHQEGAGSALHCILLGCLAHLLPLPCRHRACLWVGEAVRLPPHEQIPAVPAQRQRLPDSVVMNIHIEVGLGYEFLDIVRCSLNSCGGWIRVISWLTHPLNIIVWREKRTDSSYVKLLMWVLKLRPLTFCLCWSTVRNACKTERCCVLTSREK